MPRIVDHDEQRMQLCSTATQVIALSGLENTTLRSVAAHHGCTKGMVQHYFVDKQALLLAALLHIEGRFALRVCALAPVLQGLDLLQARLSELLPTKHSIVEEWQVRLAFSSRASVSAEIKGVLSAWQVDQQKAGLSCMRAARKLGELREDTNLLGRYRSLEALVAGLGVRAIVDPSLVPAVAQRQMLETAIDDLRC
ncbi:MAG: TetR family transcriptional regulator C-terminal domain-containing protein [Halioglobus sp.]